MLHPSLLRIPAAIDLARRTRRIIRQNISWAIGYNLLALPLAATGFVAPWEAALAMVVSSLTVTLNALRLTRAAPP
jgi:Cu2+-exporting ATPase